jgi:hypothetical protein
MWLIIAFSAFGLLVVLRGNWRPIADAISGIIQPTKNNQMKKIILSMSMVLFAFMTQAAERAHQKNHFLPETISSTNAIAPCTVTVKGSVDLGPVAVEVSCTVTSSTCPDASVQAAACLKSSLAIVSSVIL